MYTNEEVEDKLSEMPNDSTNQYVQDFRKLQILIKKEGFSQYWDYIQNNMYKFPSEIVIIFKFYLAKLKNGIIEENEFLDIWDVLYEIGLKNRNQTRQSSLFWEKGEFYRLRLEENNKGFVIAILDDYKVCEHIESVSMEELLLKCIRSKYNYVGFRHALGSVVAKVFI